MNPTLSSPRWSRLINAIKSQQSSHFLFIPKFTEEVHYCPVRLPLSCYALSIHKLCYCVKYFSPKANRIRLFFWGVFAKDLTCRVHVVAIKPGTLIANVKKSQVATIYINWKVLLSQGSSIQLMEKAFTFSDVYLILLTLLTLI